MFYKAQHSTSNSALEKNWSGIHDFILKIRFKKKANGGPHWKNRFFYFFFIS